MKTFPIGGVHPSDNKKWSCEKSIEVLELPDIVNMERLAVEPKAPVVPKSEATVEPKTANKE